MTLVVMIVIVSVIMTALSTFAALLLLLLLLLLLPHSHLLLLHSLLSEVVEEIRDTHAGLLGIGLYLSAHGRDLLRRRHGLAVGAHLHRAHGAGHWHRHL